MQSFTDFTTAHRMRPKIGCGVCDLGPAACAEIQKAWAMGYRGAVIGAWVKQEFGVDMSENRIGRHVQQEHKCEASPITSKPKSKRK